MKSPVVFSTLVVAFALTQSAVAQDEESPVYAYATYFDCSPEAESRADEIINTSYRPHYDAAVEQDVIISWNWMQHYMGGKWRRVLLIAARDLDSLLAASGALGEIIEDTTPEAGRAFSGICSSHEDYIWQTIPGVGSGSVTQARGTAGFTSYYQCDLSRQDRADELMRDVFGPLYNAQIEAGNLSSWGWVKREAGGKITRILALGGKDHRSLLGVRHAVDEESHGRRFDRASREMAEICHSREDYFWDILN